MSTGSGEGAAWREQLSALADGELDDASRVCAAWRDDPQVRETWHCYQLIGDVLRSQDLAVPPARDAALLAQVRARLAAEPVVLAPAALPAPAGERHRGWRTAGAVAAGFVAVAGVYTVMRPVAEAPREYAVAAPPAVVAEVEAPARVLAASQVAPSLTAGDARLRLVRDARLDAYLAAHKQFAGSSSIATHPVYVTSETVPAGR